MEHPHQQQADAVKAAAKALNDAIAAAFLVGLVVDVWVTDATGAGGPGLIVTPRITGSV